MNPGPDNSDNRNPDENVFARIAALLPPESQPRFWAFFTDWAARAGPTDRLFLIVEGLAYMVLSLHDIPGQLERQRTLIHQDIWDSVEVFQHVRKDMAFTAARSALLIRKATKDLVLERERYDRAIEEGFKRIENNLELRLAEMPWAYARTTVSTMLEWIKEHSREVLLWGLVPLLGIIALAFYVGYCLGHGH